MGPQEARPEEPLRELRPPREAEEESSTMDCGRAVLVFFAVAVPNAALLVALSGIGEGLKVFNQTAPYSLVGDCLFGGAAFVAAVLYVCNWPNWSTTLQVASMALPWGLGCAGTMFKSRKYPYGPMVMCMFLLCMLIGLLRAGPCKRSRREYFYRVTYLSTYFFAIVLGAMWIGWVSGGKNWNSALKEEWVRQSQPIYDRVYSERALNFTDDCGPNRNISHLALEVRADVKDACNSADRVLFMVWCCPFAAALTNTVIGLFVCLNGVVAKFDDRVLDRDLKRFVIGMAVLITGMYCSAYAAGTDMRLGSTLMAFSIAGIIALIGWVLLEVGSQVITQSITQSKFAKMAQNAAQSDWVRALCVGPGFFLIPVLWALEMMRRRFARLFAVPGDSRDMVTENTEELIGKLSVWNWTGIMLKICLLGEVFFVFQVGVAKATYIFLSWMNDQLASLEFGLVVAIIIGIGFVMFLLPPVPGVPVYVFSGVVIGAQGARIESIGFTWGTVIAVGVAWGLKLVACCGQYMIGFYLGKLVRVQQLIGVDKVLTRAIQMILEKKGLDLGKVAVLVGGPDWPVSVTCGILRLNVFQMLLGTAPVIVTLAPCTMAGAFLTRAKSGENSIWNVLASVSMSVAVMGQMGSALLAVYYTTITVDKYGAELEKPREEHRAVEELTRKEMAYNRSYQQATAWKNLPVFRKALLLLATGMMLLQGFVFAFLDYMCFENFSVSSKIDDPLDENGLGGDVTNIVIVPVGVAALGLFVVAFILHFIVVTDLQCLARKEHAKREEEATPSTAKRVPPQMMGASTG